MKLAFWRKDQPKKTIVKRAYQSARHVPYMPNWVSSPTSPNIDIKHGLLSLRARSREAFQNSSFVRRFVSLVRTNVVGETGITLQSRVAFNRDGKPDEQARASVEKAFKEWGSLGSPDVTGTKTFLQICNEFWNQILIDGEYLAIEVYSSDNPFGFQLQVIDPMMLDVQYSRDDLTGGRYIREGIEYNSFGKPLAYHFIADQDHDYQYSVTGRRYKQIPASRVHHVFLTDFVNQRRGVPALACALLRLGMLDGYTEAELVAARLGASTMGVWIDNQDGQGYQGVKPTETDDDGNEVIAEDEDPVHGASPGDFIRAPHGSKLDVFDPNHPNAGYSQFTSDLLREIASGFGVSYASLSNNYADANYSSLRQAALVEQDCWKAMQTWMIDYFVRPVFESWLKISYVNDAIQINGKKPSFPVEHYLPATWQPKRWAWVDPLKEIKAHETAINMRISSPQEIIRAKGSDPETVLQEIEAWQQELDKRNIKPSHEGFFIGAEENVENEED